MVCRDFLCVNARRHTLPYECPLAIECEARRDFNMTMRGKSPQAIGMGLLVQRKKLEGKYGSRRKGEKAR